MIFGVVARKSTTQQNSVFTIFQYLLFLSIRVLCTICLLLVIVYNNIKCFMYAIYWLIFKLPLIIAISHLLKVF